MKDMRGGFSSGVKETDKKVINYKELKSQVNGLSNNKLVLIDELTKLKAEKEKIEEKIAVLKEDQKKDFSVNKKLLKQQGDKLTKKEQSYEDDKALFEAEKEDFYKHKKTFDVHFVKMDKIHTDKDESLRLAQDDNTAREVNLKSQKQELSIKISEYTKLISDLEKKIEGLKIKENNISKKEGISAKNYEEAENKIKENDKLLTAIYIEKNEIEQRLIENRKVLFDINQARKNLEKDKRKMLVDGEENKLNRNNLSDWKNNLESQEKDLKNWEKGLKKKVSLIKQREKRLEDAK